VIPHRKHRLFNRLFVAYARSRLRGTFTGVRLTGVEHAIAALRAGPVVFVANHTCWWDSLALMWLTNYVFAEEGPADGYALMDARNLRRFSFFGLLGVFGVDLDDAEDRARVVDYAAGLLEGPWKHVWIFPQGAERPITERPVRFRRGAAVMAARSGATVVPMALRFSFGRQDKPDAWVAFGPALPASEAALAGEDRSGIAAAVAAQEAAVEALLDTLEDAVRAAARGEERLPMGLPGRRGVLGQVAERALSMVLRIGRRRRISRR
jgi:1-acyl-sn-glycerol-3-phosphate acyltransferase